LEEASCSVGPALGRTNYVACLGERDIRTIGMDIDKHQNRLRDNPSLCIDDGHIDPQRPQIH